MHIDTVKINMHFKTLNVSEGKHRPNMYVVHLVFRCIVSYCDACITMYIILWSCWQYPGLDATNITTEIGVSREYIYLKKRQDTNYMESLSVNTLQTNPFTACAYRRFLLLATIMREFQLSAVRHLDMTVLVTDFT